MSTSRCALPYTYKQMSPPDDTGAITEFGIVCPPTKFKLLESGRVPHGYTVTKPPPTNGFSPSTAVTFNATAPIPPDGNPPRPATFN